MRINIPLHHSKNAFYVGSIGLALLCSGSLNAADDITEDLSEELFFSEVPLVLSATRLSQPLTETPAAITVINRELIDASGAITIAELFRLVPGFQVGFYSGSKPTITYHGNSDSYARDMQVLIDGRSIYDPAFGGVTWLDQELEIDDIRRIEVIRGPNAASYGSNSYAGVINIQTMHASELQGTRLKTTLGKNGHQQLYARHAGTIGDLDYRISAKADKGDGFETRDFDSYDTHWFNFRGDYQLDINNTLLIELGLSDGDRNDGFPNDLIQPPRTTRDNHNFQQLRWTSNLGEKGEIQLQAYHNYQRIDDNFLDQIGDPDIPLPPNYIQAGYGFESHRYDLEFQHSLDVAEDIRLVWGLGARQDRATGFWTFATYDWIKRNQYRGFGNLEWRLTEKLIMNLGGMYEKFDRKEGFFSPRLAFNYKATKNHVLRFVSTKAYRMPTFWEDFGMQGAYTIADTSLVLPLYSNTENIEPEENHSLELGYLINLPKYGLQLDIKAYKETYRNLIAEVRDKSTDIFFYTNSGTYHVRGWEVGLDWKPTKRSLLHVAYSRASDSGDQQKKFPDEGDIDDFRNLRGRVPEQTFSVLGSYRFDSGYQVAGAFYYMDTIVWAGDGDDAPRSHRTDLNITKEFKITDVNGKLGLFIQRYSKDYYDFYIGEHGKQGNRWADRVFLQLTLDWL